MDDSAMYNVPPGGYPQLIPPSGYAQMTPPSINIQSTPVYEQPDPYIRVPVPPTISVKEQKLEKALIYNKVRPTEKKVLKGIHSLIPHMNAASMKKLIHLFSPGGAMNTFVILMTLALGLLQVVSFTIIVGFLTVGTASATNASIILYPLVGGMFTIGVIICAGLAAFTKEDGTLMLMGVTILLLIAAGWAVRVMLLIDTSPLTTTTCTGIQYPEDILTKFCTHFNVTSTNSYESDPLVVWTNKDGRNDIINAELCRNRSWLWYAYAINIGLFLVDVGLAAAVITFIYYRRPSIANVTEQFKGVLILDQNAESEKLEEGTNDLE